MSFDLSTVFEKEKIQAEGVWRKLYLENQLVGEVRLTAVGTPAFLEEMEKVQKEYRRQHQISRKKELTSVQQLEVLTEAMARKCLLDWRGVDDKAFPIHNGQVLPCTLDNKRFLLQSNTIRGAIQELAVDVSDCTMEDLEEDQGN